VREVLLDKYLPRYDFTEVHTIKIQASPETVYRALRAVTLKEIHWFVKFLLDLRALPEKMAGRNDQTMTLSAGQPLIGQMLENGFVIIEEQTPVEIVFGLIVPGSIGRVWRESSGSQVVPANAAEFIAFNDPDYLHVIANLMVRETDNPDVMQVYTESRTRGLSEKARKSFRLYWWIIRPWSGLIRRLWLKAIKKRVERT
jgi:hypothetical protein